MISVGQLNTENTVSVTTDTTDLPCVLQALH